MNSIPTQLTQDINYIEWKDNINVSPIFVGDNYSDLSENIPFTCKNGDKTCKWLISDGRALEFPYSNNWVFLYKWAWATPDFIDNIEKTRLNIQDTLYSNETFNRKGLWLCTYKEAIAEKQWADLLINRWIKTAKIAWIYKLDKVTLSNGKKQSVKELKNWWILPYESTPVVMVRHQKTNIRVSHFIELLTKGTSTDFIKMKKRFLPEDINKYFTDFVNDFVYGFFPLILEWYKVSTVDNIQWSFALMSNLSIYWEKLDVSWFSNPSFDFSKFSIDKYISFIFSEFKKISWMIFYYKNALNIKWLDLDKMLKETMAKSIFKIRIESIISKSNERNKLLTVIKNMDLFIDKLLVKKFY